MMPVSKKIFSKETGIKTFMALKCIALSEKPVGSWILKEKMEEMGESISLATVGRLLQEMDRLGFTILIQSHGRIISEEGRQQLESMENNFERMKIEEEMKEATQPESPEDILDLLRVRVVIESEIVKLIVENASEEDIELLEEAVKIHQHHVSEKLDVETLPINFHSVLSEISSNRILNSVLKLLIHEEMKLEEKFSEISSKLRDAHHLVEHELILKAIKERDATEAVQQIESHIQKLIESITN